MIHSAEEINEEEILRRIRVLYRDASLEQVVATWNHEHKPQWESELRTGEMLCYARAELDKTSLDICEAALIFHYRPVCNGTADKNFHHDTTHIVMSGAVGLLNDEITVERTAP